MRSCNNWKKIRRNECANFEPQKETKKTRSYGLKLPGIIQLAKFPVRDICIAPKIVTSTLPPLIMAKLSSLEK